MPIYEYQCGECQHEFEALQKMSDPALVDCPECSKPALIKKISAAAFRLSGGGWYETDFKSGNKKNLAGEGGKTDKPADKSADKKESKPADASKSSTSTDKKTPPPTTKAS
jgi:putative FmdB family regulatory protein